MRDLIDYAQENEHLQPREALQQLVDSYQMLPQQQQQHHQQQLQLQLQQQFSQHVNLQPHMMNNMPVAPPPGSGMRTPGLGGPQFASPAHANLALPMNNMASPHMRGSPAQPPHMQAQGVQMVQQQSQQGHTSSATGSSSASPNVTNKRRRASAIKQEGNGEDAIPDLIAAPKAKVKASPRVGGKRQKGNAS